MNALELQVWFTIDPNYNDLDKNEWDYIIGLTRGTNWIITGIGCSHPFVITDYVNITLSDCSYDRPIKKCQDPKYYMEELSKSIYYASKCWGGFDNFEEDYKQYRFG